MNRILLISMDSYFIEGIGTKLAQYVQCEFRRKYGGFHTELTFFVFL